MNKIKTWVRRARYYLKHDFLTVENVVLLFAIILCLVWTYQSIKAMSRNWDLSEKLMAENKELELLTVETEEKRWWFYRIILRKHGISIKKLSR